MSRLSPFLVAALFAIEAVAQTQWVESKPQPEQLAADSVLEAIEAKDWSQLAILAEANHPDPWLIAYELSVRGKHSAARAFSSAGRRPGNDRLQECVATLASAQGLPEFSATLAKANHLLAAGQWKAALEILSAPSSKLDAVSAIRFTYGRGLALRGLNSHEGSTGAFLEAAKQAEGLGWLAGACDSLFEAGVSACMRSDFGSGIRHWDRLLAMEQGRQNNFGVARALSAMGNAHENLGPDQARSKRAPFPK